MCYIFTGRVRFIDTRELKERAYIFFFLGKGGFLAGVFGVFKIILSLAGAMGMG